jgi:conjugative transfer signal peptidase TraF
MSTHIVLLALTVGAATTVAVTLDLRPAPRLLWNASESVPKGLYVVQPARRLIVADLVVAFPPEPIASFLADGGHLPRGIPLVKRILALQTQIVCRRDLAITVDALDVGAARERDSRGRPLPVWQGCHMVRRDEVFLMNSSEPASLDSRYFGPLPLSAIAGRATPLWTLEKQ